MSPARPRLRAWPGDHLRRTLAPLLAGLLFAALRDAADGLAIATGSLLAPLPRLAAAQLPDPGQPSTVGIGLVLGGLVSGAIARLRRLPHEQVSRLTLGGSFVGGWIAAVGWTIALFTP
jgi:hypothetical protein